MKIILTRSGSGLALLVLLLVTTSGLASSGDLELTSFKRAMVSDGNLFVSAGTPDNHTGFQDQLRVLWDESGEDVRTDSYKQPWREVPVDQLQKIFGEFDRRYLLISRGEAHELEVQGAFIWEWACAGDLIPVLDLGPYGRDGTHWFGVTVIGVNEFPENVKIETAPESVIPEDFYGPLRNPGGIEIWVDGVKRYSYIYSNEDHNATPSHILIDHTSGESTRVIERSPMDLRC